MTRARDLANIADGTFTATDLNLSGTLDVSGDATFDTNTLFVDVSANNVGIGTTSPAQKLDVSSAGTTRIQVKNTNLTSSGLYVAEDSTGAQFNELGAYPMRFHTSGTERMRIDSSGNVGIGTTSPSAPLDAHGSAALVANFNGTNANGGYVRFQNSGTSIGDIGAGAQVFSGGTAGDFGITSRSGNLVFGTSTTERARIDSSGNVGIGTTSPSAPFHANVSGTLPSIAGSTVGLFSRSANCDVSIIAGSTHLARVNFGDNSSETVGQLAYSNGNNSMRFTTNSAEAMRIDSSGNLLVGRTDVGFDAEAIVLRERGEAYITSDGRAPLLVNRLTSDGDILSIRKDGTTIGSIGSNSGTNLYLTSGGRGLRFNDNDFSPITSANAYSDNTTDLGRTAARFDDIYATNGTIQTSDANEKENIRELLEAEARVAQAAKGLLRAFQWKDSVAEKGDDARIHFGIIAQDLQAAFEAEGLDAGRYAMFIHSTWTDEETGEERSRMGVRYSELLAFIIAAL